MTIPTGNARKKLLSLFFIYALVVGITLSAYAFGFFDSWQEKIYDRLYTREETEQSIIIISIDDESLNEIGQWPWQRDVFGDAVRNVRNAKAIGIDVSFSEPSRAGAADDRLFAEALRDVGSTTPIVLPVQLAVRGKVSAEPLPQFAAYVQTGFVNIPVDLDSVARRTVFFRDGYSSFPALLAEAASSGLLQTAPAEFRIRYHGPQGTFLTIPFIDLVEGRVPPSVLDGSVVLIGATASDLHDVVETPFGLMPGVEVHANALVTMLDASYPQPMPPWAASVLIAFADLVALVAITRARRLITILPTLVSLALFFNLFGFALFSYGILYPAFYLNGSILAIIIISFAFQYLAESHEKRFIRSSFQYYLTPEVVSELIEHPEKLSLGGERREMTILFSDIRDFTAISERLSPHELTRIMNEYLTAMTDIIMEHRGMVDKYIGDAIMAFWGAPLDNPEQAADACRAALHMSQRLTELNIQWKAVGSPELAMRIGIATGSVIVGNMGSSRRFNYTVMGDEVNFASRLEGLNKVYGTECLVSEATKSVSSSPELFFRELDRVRVKGKQEARAIFELHAGTLSDSMKRQFHHFDAGRESYARGDWSDAIAHFTKVLETGDDGPARALLKRSEEFNVHPPKEWDGVQVFKDK
ncbi:MAG TPA: adenylate/guanylate cyclase domain-containing protein [Candidatus Paceibacterota bacterium]